MNNSKLTVILDISPKVEKSELLAILDQINREDYQLLHYGDSPSFDVGSKIIIESLDDSFYGSIKRDNGEVLFDLPTLDRDINLLSLDNQHASPIEILEAAKVRALSERAFLVVTNNPMLGSGGLGKENKDVNYAKAINIISTINKRKNITSKN